MHWCESALPAGRRARGDTMPMPSPSPGARPMARGGSGRGARLPPATFLRAPSGKARIFSVQDSKGTHAAGTPGTAAWAAPAPAGSLHAIRTAVSAATDRAAAVVPHPGMATRGNAPYGRPPTPRGSIRGTRCRQFGETRQLLVKFAPSSSRHSQDGILPASRQHHGAMPRGCGHLERGPEPSVFL